MKKFTYSLLGVTCLFFSAPSWAQTTSANSDEVAKLLTCQTETDDLKRLACYDLAVGQFVTAQEQGEIFTVSKEQIQNVERDSFGFSIPSLPILSGLFGGDEKVKSPKGNDLTAPVKTLEASARVTPPKIKVPGLSESPSIDEVSLTIVKTQNFGYRKTRFFMENGQVWEQINTANLRIPKISKDNKPIAEIRKGALGSFLLQIDGKGRAVGVKRVR